MHPAFLRNAGTSSRASLVCAAQHTGRKTRRCVSATSCSKTNTMWTEHCWPPAETKTSSYLKTKIIHYPLPFSCIPNFYLTRYPNWEHSEQVSVHSHLLERNVRTCSEQHSNTLDHLGLNFWWTPCSYLLLSLTFFSGKKKKKILLKTTCMLLAMLYVISSKQNRMCSNSNNCYRVYNFLYPCLLYPGQRCHKEAVPSA